MRRRVPTVQFSFGGMFARCFQLLAVVAAATCRVADAAGVTTSVAQGVRAQANAAASAGLRQLSNLEQSQADAAAILGSLLKKLESESEAGKRAAESMGKWCKESVGQKAAMVQTIQRQLDEAAIAIKQVGSDSKRLKSEQNLIQSTSEEKAQQLQDAMSTAELASSEYAGEKRELENTIEAARHAVRLLTQSQAQGGLRSRASTGAAVDSVKNLMQLSNGAMTDAESKIMSAYTSGQTSGEGSASSRPQMLLQTLNGLLARLQQNQNEALQEHQNMARKLWSFTDHLNSSIIETRSQVAALTMEMAQRKRERTRLDGKVSDLSSLLQAIRASTSTTEAACAEHEQQTDIATRYAAAEEDAVRTVLESTSPESSDVFLQAPTLLQVRARTLARGELAAPGVAGDLQALAKAFPEDAHWYTEAAGALGAARSTVALMAQPAQVASASSSSSSSSSPLQDIEAFAGGVGTDASLDGERPAVTDPEEAKKVKGIYESLLGRVQEKSRSVEDREKWCLSITRDAKAEGASVARTLKRMDAKLNLVKVAMLEYSKGSSYNQEQHDFIDVQLRKLDALGEETAHGNARFYDSLGGLGKQLMSLVTELNQDLTTEERRSAEMTRSLVAKVENHQNLLQQQHVLFEKRRAAIGAADRAVQEALSATIAHNNRRLLRLKSEMQFLSSLSRAKANDRALSHRYREISETMCSKGREAGLKAEEKSLQKQADALQHSYQANVAPIAA